MQRFSSHASRSPTFPWCAVTEAPGRPQQIWRNDDESAMHQVIQSGSTAAFTEEESQTYAEEHQGEEWELEYDEDEPEELDLIIQAYRDDNKDVEFKFFHVFKQIESCDKWTLTWRHSPRPKRAASILQRRYRHPGNTGPSGQKAAKAERNAGPAAKRLQASVDKCIIDATVREEEKARATTAREEKSNERWSMMLGNQETKIGILKDNVATKKANAAAIKQEKDLPFL
ncbi:hypothetical protein QYE76_041119 [Lolium multiflorum]|uniref:Uncharacterized protein n=1 Tax=Lolium multiflorum TaxID=4521 RepID=A0AAD8TD66_LOLMU|nr:hypothetical protein QYE76_041119 [Lolium multiflorum]